MLKSARSNLDSVVSHGCSQPPQAPQGTRPPDFLRQNAQKTWIHKLDLRVPPFICCDRLSISVASSLILPPLWVCIDANKRLRRRWTLIPVGPQAPTVQEWSISSSPAISPPEGALTSWSFTARRVPSNKESVPCLHSGVLLTIQTYGSQDQIDPPSMTCS